MKNTNTNSNTYKTYHFRKYDTLTTLERGILVSTLKEKFCDINVYVWSFGNKLAEQKDSDQKINKAFENLESEAHAVENYFYGIYDGFLYTSLPIRMLEYIRSLKSLTYKLPEFKELVDKNGYVRKLTLLQDDVDEFVQTIKKRIQENPEYQLTERSAHLQNMDI